MEAKDSWASSLLSIAIGLGLICLAAIAVLYFCLEPGECRLVELPNGSCALVYGSSSCAQTPSSATVKAGGHVFAFSPTTVSVDNVVVAPLDASTESVEIDANCWTATLRINGTEVPIVQ